MLRKEEARKEAGARPGGVGDDGQSPGSGAAAGPAGPGAQSSAPVGPPGGEPAAVMPAADPQLASLRDQLARARADYENLQRRVARDATAETERTRARVLEGFLPLLELAHMAAQQAETHPGPLSEGVQLLAREFDRMAEREGLTRLGTKGEKADPARHEVIATEGADGVASGCVSRVVQPGYLLGSRVLRYAKVCVAP